MWQRASFLFNLHRLIWIRLNKTSFVVEKLQCGWCFYFFPPDKDCVAAKETGEVGAHEEGTASAESLTAWCVLIYQKTIPQCWGTVFTACTSPRASGSSDVDFLECQRFRWPLLEPQTGRDGGRGERILRVLSPWKETIAGKLLTTQQNMCKLDLWIRPMNGPCHNIQFY